MDIIANARKGISKKVEEHGRRLGFDLSYFLSNGFWVVLRHSVGAASGMLVSVALAHLSGQEVFGQYQLVLSILSIASILAVPAMNTSLVQSVAKGNDGDYRRAVRASFLWSLWGVPVLTALGMAYYVLESRIIGTALFLSAVFFPFFYSLGLWDGFLQAKRRYGRLARIVIAQSVLSSMCLLTAIFLFRDVLPLIIAAHLGITAIFNAVLTFRVLSFVENERTDPDAISYGFFLNKLTVLAVIGANLDRVIVGIFVSVEQLSVYAVGMLFAVQIFDFTKAVLSVAAPKIANNTAVSRKHYWTAFFGGLSCVPFFLGGTWLALKLFYPAPFWEAWAFSAISLAFYPFFVVSVLYNFRFLFARNRKATAWAMTVFQVLKIFLMFALAFLFQASGLAFVVGFQYLLLLIVLFFFERRFVPERDGAIAEENRIPEQ
jgi:O-antigen/teichoic acid export membrane protein